MTEDECYKLIEKHKDDTISLLMLQSWQIDFEVSKLPDDHAAQCWTKLDYLYAKVYFDNEQIKTEELFCKALVHELLHVVMARFDMVQEFAMAHHVPKTGFDIVLNNALEATLVHFHRVLELSFAVGKNKALEVANAQSH